MGKFTSLRSSAGNLFRQMSAPFSRGSVCDGTRSFSRPSTCKRQRWGRNWWPIAVGLITIAYCVPFFRYVWLLGDEGILLNGAERMLRGDIIYIDFFEFLPPGGFFIIEAWLQVAGFSILGVRVLVILLIAAVACLIYVTCRQVSKFSLSSAFVALAWLVLSEGWWVQLNHHWFATLFSMVAVWAALASIERPRQWPFWPLVAGIAAGAAVTVTPHRGALSMFAAAIAFLNLRRYGLELMIYVLGAAFVMISTLAYLTAHHALIAAYNDLIIFTATRYASIQGVAFGGGSSFLLKWLFPIVALLMLFACARHWARCRQDRTLWVCAAFGLAGFGGCFPRPDQPHLTWAAPLVCPLLGYCIRALAERWLSTYRYIAAVITVTLLIPPVHRYEWWARAALRGQITPTPRGNVTLVPPGAGELAERIALTSARDSYFFYPYDTLLPFLTGRPHVSAYEIFVPGYTLPYQYREACVSAMRDASWVVVDRDWTNPQFLTNIFPEMQDPDPPEKKKFDQALNTGFEFVARYGIFEIRRRVRTVDEGICADISG
jgi:hypothetical protein